MRKATILLICGAALAQSPPAADPKDDKDAVIRTSVNVVIAPTTVRDKKGEFIDGLQLQDFQLYDNNKLQRITADVRDEPLSLVIAVQKSSNLNDILPKIQRIGSMLNDLVAGQDGEVAVVAFDHRFQVAQDFTNETEKVSEALKKLVPGSANHAVIDAEMQCIRMLRNRPRDRRRVLLIIAEKRDRGSEARLREALTEAQFANVAIYSLDISSAMATLTTRGDPPPPPSIPTTAQHVPAGAALTPTTIDQNYYLGNAIPVFVDIFKGVKSLFVDDTLDVFTRFTGGKEYAFVSERSLEKAVEGISQELHSQYLLSYTPNNQIEGGFHDIRVVVNRNNLEVRTRPGYWVATRAE
ncbi:MAG TPA: VWA domain-containing protein [Bryobacteraceae bacterium]|nr:VWA domain-containing protein [Bryobacteraceae bacterium]